MQWYYAVGSERRGPVDTVTFSGLVNKGMIQPDTLVWRTGMAEWQPWSVIAPSVAGELVAPTDSGSTALGGAPLVETPWPGQAATGTVEDLPMEELWARIKSRGYNTSIGRCLSLGMAALKTNYWGALGTTLLFILLSGVAQNIPLLGLLASFLVVPQLTGGAWLYFIRQARGEDHSVGDIFEGFKRGFGSLALVALFQFLLMLPFIGVLLFMMLNFERNGNEPGAGVITAIFLVGLVLFYITMRWQFAHAIIVERGYTAIDAIKLSWRIIGLRFWTLLGLGLLMILFLFAGALALIVGLFFVIPVISACAARAYVDAIDQDS